MIPNSKILIPECCISISNFTILISWMVWGYSEKFLKKIDELRKSGIYVQDSGMIGTIISNSGIIIIEYGITDPWIWYLNHQNLHLTSLILIPERDSLILGSGILILECNVTDGWIWNFNPSIQDIDPWLQDPDPWMLNLNL